MADLRKLKDKAAEAASKGKLEKAADLFRRALDGDPDDVATRQKLGDVLRRTGRIDDAIEQYRGVADRYGRDGLLIKAIAISKTILELDPDHVDTQVALADLYARRAKAEASRPPTRQTLMMAAVRAPAAPPAPAPRPATEDRIVAIPLAPAVPPPPSGDAIPLDAGPATAGAEPGWAGAEPFDPGAVSIDAAAAEPDAAPLDVAVDDAHALSAVPARAPPAVRSPATPLDAIVSAAADAGVDEDVVLEPEPLDEVGALAGDEPLDPWVPPAAAPPPAASRPPPPGPAPRAAPSAPAPAPRAAPPARPAPPAPAPPPRAPSAPARPPPPSGPALPRVPIFSDLSRDAFVALTTAMALRRVAPGEAVIREGDGGTSFYVVATGRLAVSKRNDRGDEVPLARLGEGEFFGEMALLSGAPRSATVAAEEPSEVLEFRADVLVDVARKHPHVAESLRRFYRQRLLANAMAVSPIFRPFAKGDRKLVVERFRAREVRAGEVVIREGEPSDGLYVVLEGAVDVVKWGEGGNVVVGRLREGDLFGEMSCLRKSPATASVVVARPGTLLRLPRREFDELVVTHPQVLELVSELSEERSENLDAILSGRAEWTDEGLVLV